MTRAKFIGIGRCIASISSLPTRIHKDPMKLRVALLAAYPPDNTATQPFRDRSLRSLPSTVNIFQSDLFANHRQEWSSNIRADILSGIVFALALIPEAVGFSLVKPSS